MCAVYETTEIIAIATAAVRDAVNGPNYPPRAGKDRDRLHGRIGREARLIYLGVSSGLEHSKSLRLFIDIGGGNTELIVGDSQSYVNLDSLKLGCVRLTNLFFEDNKGPVSAYTYAALQRYVRNEALHSFQRIAGFEIPEAVASSGTAQNLAEIAAALEQQDAARTGKPSTASKHVLSYDGLRRAVKELCSRTLEA
ncbi:MAG: Ppx/GppA phosphatase family protein [Bilophila wadsworthia]